MKKSKMPLGFTLTEILISIGLFSVMMVFMGRMLINTSKINNIVSAEVNLRGTIDNTEEVLKKELRKAYYFFPYGTTAPTADPNRVTIPTLPYSTTTPGNGLYYLTHELVKLPGNATGTAANSSIQRVVFNYLYLRKDKDRDALNPGRLELVLYQNRSYYNNVTTRIFPNPVTSPIPSGATLKSDVTTFFNGLPSSSPNRLVPLTVDAEPPSPTNPPPTSTPTPQPAYTPPTSNVSYNDVTTRVIGTNIGTKTNLQATTANLPNVADYGLSFTYGKLDANTSQPTNITVEITQTKYTDKRQKYSTKNKFQVTPRLLRY